MVATGATMTTLKKTAFTGQIFKSFTAGAINNALLGVLPEFFVVDCFFRVYVFIGQFIQHLSYSPACIRTELLAI